MDFDELRRLSRGVHGAVDEALKQMQERDSMVRSIREMDSVGRALREMNAASHFQDAADSAARTLREVSAAERLQSEVNDAARRVQEVSELAGIRDSRALGLREMDPPVTGLDHRQMELLTGGPALRDMDFVTGGLREQARAYFELEDSIQRQIRERLHDFERAGVTSAIRDVVDQKANEDWKRTVAEVSERLSSAFALARSANFEELNRRAETLRDLTAGSPVFSMLARELAQSVSAGALTPALADGFGGQLFGYIEDAEAAGSEKEIVDFLKAFLVWLLSLAQRLPGTNLSNEAILSIFLTVATVLYQKYDGAEDVQATQEKIEQVGQETWQLREELRESDEESSKELREMEARLMERIGQIDAEDDDAREYVIIEAAKLRKGPGKDFEALQVLPPNVQVEELGREGEWMRVQYFDYAEGELREGWIAAELLVEKRGDD